MASLPEFEFVCPEANRLEGEGPTLFCGRCDREVHDLSAMTRAESQLFLEGCQGKKLCVRFDREVATGAIRHRAEPAPRRVGHLGKVTLALGLGIGGLAMAQVALKAATSAGPTAARPGAGGLVFAAAPGPVDRLQAAVEAALADAARRPVVGEQPEVPLADVPLPDAPVSDLRPPDEVVDVPEEVEPEEKQPPVEREEALPPRHIERYGGAMVMPSHKPG